MVFQSVVLSYWKLFSFNGEYILSKVRKKALHIIVEGNRETLIRIRIFQGSSVIFVGKILAV